MGEENKSSQEGINAKFDWDSSFFRQIERINTSNDPVEMRMNIDRLWALLACYLDDEYKTDIDLLFEDLGKKIVGYNKMGGLGTLEINGVIWQTLLSEYAALMKLAFRNKVLPQRNIAQKSIGKDVKKKESEKNIGVDI